jgi:hypothetical protein
VTYRRVQQLIALCICHVLFHFQIQPRQPAGLIEDVQEVLKSVLFWRGVGYGIQEGLPDFSAIAIPVALN